jgi:iron(III) transport system substrate-binding protein
MKKLLLTSLTCLILLAGCGEKEESKVTLYSAQTEHLIRPVLEMFTRDTGIKVELITGDKAALITQLEQEGKHTPADLLLTADIGNIIQAQQKGLLQPIYSETLKENIPATLRDPKSEWFALTKRVRAVFVRKDSDVKALSYLDLADAAFKGGILVRSSDNVYNQSLVASLIHHYGEEKTLAWATSLVSNFARNPQGGDADQLSALAAGEGTLAIANSYYYGNMITEGSAEFDSNVKNNLRIIFPSGDDMNTHVNIRGGGVTKHAKHAEEAMALLEYLSKEDAQQFFTRTNLEYPVNPKVPAYFELAKWGEFTEDTLSIAEIGALQQQAIKLMDKAGWK